VPGVELLSPVQGNEIFAAMPVSLVQAIEAEGYLLQPWENPEAGRQVIRMVTAFNTDPKAVDGLLAVAAKRRAA
jgi:threonine aldolase